MSEFATSLEMESGQFKNSCLVALTELHEDPKNIVKPGPLYHALTSQGQEVSVFTATVSPPYTSTRILHLVEQKLDGTVVGVRRTKLLKEKDGYYAGGEILVGDKGKGFASPLEYAHFDLLQRFADEENVPITYEVQAENPRAFRSIRNQFNDGSSEISADYFQQREQQVNRWHRLYSPHGKLGFGHDNMRTFSPRAHTTPLSEIVDITLIRHKNSESRHEEIEVEERVVDDTVSANAIKTERLASGVIPALRAVSDRTFTPVDNFKG
jgi:hypothetical protein